VLYRETYKCDGVAFRRAVPRLIRWQAIRDAGGINTPERLIGFIYTCRLPAVTTVQLTLDCLT